MAHGANTWQYMAIIHGNTWWRMGMAHGNSWPCMAMVCHVLPCFAMRRTMTMYSTTINSSEYCQWHNLDVKTTSENENSKAILVNFYWDKTAKDLRAKHAYG